jgi:U3 small nucleolar RNA-associated protein 6
MAELVQRNIELLLPIFDELKKDTVFEQDELRQIVRIVQEHEYNLQRADKDKELFIAYIQYMQTLLLLIEKRYQKNGQRTNPDVRHQMIVKIKLLFRKAVYRHQGDLSLWFSFINFAKRRSMQPLIGKLYNRMLQIHSDKPQIWISAAKWAFESNTIGVARTYFQRAFRSNSKSKQLFVEYFRFELLYIELISKRKEVLVKVDDSSDASQRSMFGKVDLCQTCQSPELIQNFVFNFD